MVRKYLIHHDFWVISRMVFPQDISVCISSLGQNDPPYTLWSSTIQPTEDVNLLNIATLSGQQLPSPKSCRASNGAAGPAPCLGQNLGPVWAGPQFCMRTFSPLRCTPFPHQILSLGPHHLWIASSVDSHEAEPEVLESQQ